MSSKARRPYLMNKKSVTQFYQAPVRYLREIEAKESEFEKPYVDEDYRKMHLDFPWPDFPPFPPLSPWPPLPPFEGPTPGLPGCAITCYPPHNDCDNPVWCHPSIWCGSDIGCTLCSWTVEGAVKGYTPHASGVGSWGIDIWIDEDLVEADGKALISACMTDPCGNVCCNDIEVSCKICPPDISISWDNTSSPSTIGSSSEAEVYVQDGIAPYSWSVSGTGFSLRRAKTDTVSNTLITDGAACGKATITVTDFCGDVTTGYVRCTTGSWNEIDNCSMNGGYASNCRVDYSTDNQYKYTNCAWCCDPAVCGVDTTCCPFYWRTVVDCNHCSTGQGSPPTWTSVKMSVKKEEWVC